MNDRVDPLGKPDVSGFTPRKPEAKPDVAAIKKVAATASFVSREPKIQQQPPQATQRRHWVQFQCKAQLEVEEQIYALNEELKRRADALLPGVRWTVGMTLERMAAALERELREGKPFDNRLDNKTTSERLKSP